MFVREFEMHWNVDGANRPVWKFLFSCGLKTKTIKRNQSPGLNDFRHIHSPPHAFMDDKQDQEQQKKDFPFITLMKQKITIFIYFNECVNKREHEACYFMYITSRPNENHSLILFQSSYESHSKSVMRLNIFRQLILTHQFTK